LIEEAIGDLAFWLTFIPDDDRRARHPHRLPFAARPGFAPQLDFGVDLDRPTPAQNFHDETWLPLCDRIATAVIERAGRELTLEERRRIWETRAPLILETALKEIEAGNDASITALIASLPSGLRRPDPTNWMRIPLN
jgi:hypothetical protein